ncbi:MAG: methyl-accepting chemotaxis protein [Defluviitaleaceae bacterium]|nr:methyl-accepting chemotaxis protein [Defluviitaleaceae bacterium]
MFRDMKLKTRVGIVLVVTLILATTMVTAVRSNQIRADLRNAINDQLMSRAYIMYTALDPIEDLTMALLRGVSRLPQVQDIVVGVGTREETNDTLAAMHLGFDFWYDDVRLYASILIADADLNIVASAIPTVLVNISDHPNQENIRQARQGNAHISDMTISTVTGLPQKWYTYPIMDGATFLGMVIVPVNSQGLNVFLDQDISTEYDNFVLLADRAGSIYFSSHPNYLGHNISEIGIMQTHREIPKEEVFSYTSLISGMDVQAYVLFDESTDGMIISFVDERSLPNVVARTIITLLPTIIGVITASILIYLIISKALKPLQTLTFNAQEVAKGNTAVNFKVERNDEIGQVSQAFLEIVNSLNSLNNGFTKAEHEIREGNLTYQMKNNTMSGIFKQIMEDVNFIIKELKDYIEYINEPIIVIDRGYRIKFLNNTANKLTRKMTKDVMGEHINKLLNYDITQDQSLLKCLQTGESTMSESLQLPLDSESIYDMDAHFLPLTNKHKEVIGAVIFLTDFTDIRNSFRHEAKLTNYRRIQSKKLTGIIAEIEQGILTLSIPHSEFDEDTKSIAMEYKAVEEMLQKSVDFIKDYIDELTTTLGGMSQKDLDMEITRQYIGDFTVIKDSVNIILNDMNIVFSELLSASEQVTEGANIIAISSQEAAATVADQIVAMDNISQSAHRVTTQVNQNMTTVEEAAGLSTFAQESANQSNSQMTDMLVAIEEIRSSSKTIAGIIKTIEDIAFQTNLLALNASVEAARAGEHGRGFSVVAEEVRNLASRSATAVRESTVLIEDSIQKVDNGVQIAESTANSLNKIVEVIANIDQTIGQINISSAEQAHAIKTMEHSIIEMNSMIQQTSNIVTQNALATEEVSSQSEMMSSMVASFKLRKR